MNPARRGRGPPRGTGGLGLARLYCTGSTLGQPYSARIRALGTVRIVRIVRSVRSVRAARSVRSVCAGVQHRVLSSALHRCSRGRRIGGARRASDERVGRQVSGLPGNRVRVDIHDDR
jgi:hypothetical protein